MIGTIELYDVLDRQKDRIQARLEELMDAGEEYSCEEFDALMDEISRLQIRIAKNRARLWARFKPRYNIWERSGITFAE